MTNSSVPTIATNGLEQIECQKLFAFDTLDSSLSVTYPRGGAAGGCWFPSPTGCANITLNSIPLKHEALFQSVSSVNVVRKAFPEGNLSQSSPDSD